MRTTLIPRGVAAHLLFESTYLPICKEGQQAQKLTGSERRCGLMRQDSNHVRRPACAQERARLGALAAANRKPPVYAQRQHRRHNILF